MHHASDGLCSARACLAHTTVSPRARVAAGNSEASAAFYRQLKNESEEIRQQLWRNLFEFLVFYCCQSPASSPTCIPNPKGLCSLSL
jgi:hypothetical protein